MKRVIFAVIVVTLGSCKAGSIADISMADTFKLNAPNEKETEKHKRFNANYKAYEIQTRQLLSDTTSIFSNSELTIKRSEKSEKILETELKRQARSNDIIIDL